MKGVVTFQLIFSMERLTHNFFQGIDMNRLCLAILFFLMAPAISMANIGYHCAGINVKISREQVSDSTTLVVKNMVDGTLTFNSRIHLPMEESTASYQDRFGIYNELMTNAQTLFPYMPESVMVFHIMKSSKIYRKGFKAFEGEEAAVDLPDMYCKAFIQAIANY